MKKKKKPLFVGWICFFPWNKKKSFKSEKCSTLCKPCHLLCTVLQITPIKYLSFIYLPSEWEWDGHSCSLFHSRSLFFLYPTLSEMHSPHLPLLMESSLNLTNSKTLTTLLPRPFFITSHFPSQSNITTTSKSPYLFFSTLTSTRKFLLFRIGSKLRTSQDSRNKPIPKKITLPDTAPSVSEDQGISTKLKKSDGNSLLGHFRKVPRRVLAVLSNLPLAIGEMFTIAALMALGMLNICFFLSFYLGWWVWEKGNTIEIVGNVIIESMLEKKGRDIGFFYLKRFFFFLIKKKKIFLRGKIDCVRLRETSVKALAFVTTWKLATWSK